MEKPINPYVIDARPLAALCFLQYRAPGDLDRKILNGLALEMNVLFVCVELVRRELAFIIAEYEASELKEAYRAALQRVLNGKFARGKVHANGHHNYGGDNGGKEAPGDDAAVAAALRTSVEGGDDQEDAGEHAGPDAEGVEKADVDSENYAGKEDAK